ncbi:hypothetical protein RUM44_004487 [Polyplax serrata]|uniref:Uncharacterized protein n=1 Tax=Polyplax serrata TaxID=468196 RepID=A0ABR1B2Z9_POLSC
MGKTEELDYNCRMKLSEENAKTSTEISLGYSPQRQVMYDKLPYPKLPVVRMSKNYTPGTIYTPSEGLKTTYNLTYGVPLAEQNLNSLPSKLLKQHREYSKLGKSGVDIKFGATEYNTEYLMKKLPLPKSGSSVEQQTSCPMVTTGRDEREPLPLTQNYSKHLDIYLSTSRLAHRPFTLQEQKTIAMKDIVTSQETMDIPKGRGFGCKFPAFPGQDLDNRDKNMIDKALFHTEAKLRYVPQGMPRIPNFGCESETKASYTRPEGYAVPKTFAKFTEYPQIIGRPTAKQTLSPPGMYVTESQAINNHTSPQTVV